ncbi:MAG: SDR family oxidoreductase [Synergistetes bacterium]|nr:SDR family oxidoreductase [Synergistota bacterium]MDW8192621.1 SDR family NAD(P)-dependent oxidoreductase [Synergistota bacterium]
MLLKGKVAIITGASRGIGKAIALVFAQHGAFLVINGTKGELLEKLRDEIRSMGRKCIIQVGDVSDPDTGVKLAKSAFDEFGHIDILVNNAGIITRTTTLDTEPEEWRRIIEVNLSGTFYCCKAVLPYMINQKYGKIINISSTRGKAPHPNASPAYGASKAGIIYLTRHLALEMGKYNIYVNAICPGPIETEMVSTWERDYRDQVISKIPLGKLGLPEDVANLVLFLASDMSNFITGEAININGGAYMD